MADYTLAVSWSGKDALADSDANKVISGADFNTEFTTVQTSVNSKADKASPTFTGTPLSTTAAASTSNTQIATTAFVTTADNLKANLASPTFTGTPAAPTAATATDTTQIATTAFVQANTPAASSSTLGLVKASISGTTLTIATS